MIWMWRSAALEPTGVTVGEALPKLWKSRRRADIWRWGRVVALAVQMVRAVWVVRMVRMARLPCRADPAGEVELMRRQRRNELDVARTLAP